MEAAISCLCGQAHQTVTLAAQSFPIQTSLCHCDTCRSTSGVLCNVYLSLANRPTSSTNLTSYESSERFSRLFCGTCGSHILIRDKFTDAYSVASGTVEHRGDVVQITHHEFVADTGDGGLAICLPRIGDRDLKAYAGSSDRQLTFPTGPRDGVGPQARSDQGEKLYAQCHCGGVEYLVTLPDETSVRLSSPCPDLLVPYHSGSPENKEDVKWWLRAGGTKYLAGTCACRSCRLAAGFPIQSWAFIPRANIVKTDSNPLDFTMGTLRKYESSPGKFREFCRVCGATAFWHCDDRPDLIDVSIGLLRSRTGARAQDWLEWETARVSFKEDALDQELVAGLEKGLEAIKNE